MNKFLGFSIKNFKSMEGREGMVLRGVLVENGKPVVEFFDEGNGGCMDIDMLTTEKTSQFEQRVRDKYKEIGVRAQIEPVALLVNDICSLNEIVKKVRKNKLWAKKCIDVFKLEYPCGDYAFDDVLFVGSGKTKSLESVQKTHPEAKAKIASIEIGARGDVAVA